MAHVETRTPGSIVAGKYRVDRVLGVGAMGSVLAVTHLDLQEPRAIKLMHRHLLSDQPSVERFLREARATSKLRTERVARIFDVGRLEDGAPFIVMELLEGADLKRVLDARGVLSVREAAAFCMDVIEGLREAHALGIVHRDLKPGNLFLTTQADGSSRVKVVDFGIAKFDEALGSGELTSTSSMLGTPLYMSPEQMRGARNVDPRTDIWALGAILYRMVTGETPFKGMTVTEVCAAVIADDPPVPSQVRPGLPPELDAVILRCLQKRREGRFSSVDEFGAALEPFLGGGERYQANLMDLSQPGGRPSLPGSASSSGSRAGSFGGSGAQPGAGTGSTGPGLDAVPQEPTIHGTSSSMKGPAPRGGSPLVRLGLVAAAAVVLGGTSALAWGYFHDHASPSLSAEGATNVLTVETTGEDGAQGAAGSPSSAGALSSAGSPGSAEPASGRQGDEGVEPQGDASADSAATEPPSPSASAPTSPSVTVSPVTSASVASAPASPPRTSSPSAGARRPPATATTTNKAPPDTAAPKPSATTAFGGRH